MSDWLSIDSVFSTLLATSFSSVALVSLWAATSPWHWFLRLSTVFLFLSPLLVIPAHEPFLMFAAQSTLIVMAISAWQGWPYQIRRWTFSRMSTSLAGALLVTAVVAVVVAVAVQIPKEVWRDAPAALLVSATFAAAALIAAWLVFGKQSLRRRMVIASVLTLFISLPIAYANNWTDYFTNSLTIEDFQNWSNLLNPLVPWLTSIWLIVVPATTALVAGLLFLFRESRQATMRPRRHILSSLLAVLVALVMLPPALTVWKLAHPPAIPQITMPSPNGYEDFLSAGELIQKGSPMLNTVFEPKTTQDLADEIVRMSHAYDQIRLGLSRGCAVCAFPADGILQGVLSGDNLGYLRAAARALMREAELARRQNRFGDAARVSVENVQLGQSITRDGLIIDLLVGLAIEGIAHSTLYPVIEQLNAESCSATIDALKRADESREPFSEIVARDRIWTAHAYGWAGHLTQVLDDVVQPTGSSEDVIANILLPKMHAISGLLVVELALQQFKLQNGAWPKRLDELVPDFLDQIPVDPFDPAQQPFRYAISGDGYLLYSVGYDGDNDGGRPPSDDAPAWDREGDIRLDHEFAEEISSARSDQQQDVGSTLNDQADGE